MKRILIYMGIIFSSFFGCAQDKENEISLTELDQRMGKDTTLVVLDVRTPEELRGPLGKLDNIINIPVQELEARVSELNKFKEKEIAIICRTGNRSGRAQKYLKSKGFNAKNVPGGMVEYKDLHKK